MEDKLVVDFPDASAIEASMVLSQGISRLKRGIIDGTQDLLSVAAALNVEIDDDFAKSLRKHVIDVLDAIDAAKWSH